MGGLVVPELGTAGKDLFTPITVKHFHVDSLHVVCNALLGEEYLFTDGAGLSQS